MSGGRLDARRAASAALRLAGTATLTAASAVTYGGGIWSAWTFLYSHLPLPLGVVATLGTAISPIALVSDIVAADRADRPMRQKKDKSDEALD